jgi:hypothetical protein
MPIRLLLLVTIPAAFFPGCGGGDDCARITDDATMIGVECTTDADCAVDGYACQEFNGIVLMQNCQIPCTQSCECPEDLACVTVTDKAGSFMQCGEPE